MPQACAEITAALLAKLRTQFQGVVTVGGEPDVIREPEGDGPALYVVHLDSPLISENDKEVEVVVERGTIRFKRAFPL